MQRYTELSVKTNATSSITSSSDVTGNSPPVDGRFYWNQTMLHQAIEQSKAGEEVTASWARQVNMSLLPGHAHYLFCHRVV